VVDLDERQGGAVMSVPCYCAHCRPPGTDVVEALRARYKTRGAALAALGLDSSVLEEEGKTMRTRDQMEMLTPDARSRDRRRGRDEEEMMEDPEEETLEQLLERLDEGDKRMIYDAVRQLVRDRGWGSSYDRRMRRGARDDPPPFYGQPQTGGSINWSDRMAAEDRRNRFAHDVAEHRGQGFLDFFPDAARIRTTGF
jgi:hypothetical protein